ncbi:MAG: hypothetical protein CMM93_05190 [Rickettsiales bacterium]|nr:hypothetical protein [Rickettsiales bacterium]
MHRRGVSMRIVRYSLLHMLDSCVLFSMSYTELRKWQMALPDHTHAQARFKRLRYQSWHRGCKETDVILGNYFDQHAKEFSAEDLSAYEALLEEDDYDIWQWVAYEKAPSNPDYITHIERLRAFHEYRSL